MSDLIERQKAIDAIADYLSKTTYTSAISFLNTGALILAKVPSAQRIGRWIPVAGRMGKEVQCDCCGEVFWYWLTNFTYCPNCGARMEVEK